MKTALLRASSVLLHNWESQRPFLTWQGLWQEAALAGGGRSSLEPDTAQQPGYSRGCAGGDRALA